LKAGQLFDETNVRCIRPGSGLRPRHLPEILGRRASRDIPRGTPVDWSLLAA
jgi:pseudaminic acid synthase